MRSVSTRDAQIHWGGLGRYSHTWVGMGGDITQCRWSETMLSRKRFLLGKELAANMGIHSVSASSTWKRYSRV